MREIRHEGVDPRFGSEGMSDMMDANRPIVVLVATGGTSDIGVAEEAAITAEVLGTLLGVSVTVVDDVLTITTTA